MAVRVQQAQSSVNFARHGRGSRGDEPKRHATVAGVGRCRRGFSTPGLTRADAVEDGWH
jgi:hypothetical protein